MHLIAWSGINKEVPGEPVNGASVKITDTKCEEGKPVIRTATTNAEGALPDPGLPFSTYEVCVASGGKHVTATEVAVPLDSEELEAGTELNVSTSATPPRKKVPAHEGRARLHAGRAVGGRDGLDRRAGRDPGDGSGGHRQPGSDLRAGLRKPTGTAGDEPDHRQPPCRLRLARVGAGAGGEHEHRPDPLLEGRRAVTPVPNKYVFSLADGHTHRSRLPGSGAEPANWTFGTPRPDAQLVDGVGAAEVGNRPVTVPLFQYFAYEGGQVATTPLPTPLERRRRGEDGAGQRRLRASAPEREPDHRPEAPPVTLTDSATLRIEPASEDSAEVNLPCV